MRDKFCMFHMQYFSLNCYSNHKTVSTNSFSTFLLLWYLIELQHYNSSTLAADNNSTPSWPKILLQPSAPTNAPTMAQSNAHGKKLILAPTPTHG